MAQVFDPSSYALNPYALPMLLTATAMLLLGAAVLFHERGSRASRLFFLLALSITVWLVAFSWMYLAVDESVALRWAKAAYLGVPFIPAAIYHFAVVILRIDQKRRRMVWLSWLLSTAFSILILRTDMLFGDLYHYGWGYYPKYRWPSALYLLAFFGLLIASMREYWIEYHSADPGIRKRRIRAFMLAFGIGYVATIDYAAAYGLPIYPFGYLPILAFLAITAWTIRRYQLVDITPSFAAQEIIATMADPLIVCDDGRKIRVVNQAACSTFGYTEGELLGRPIDCLVDISPQGSAGLQALFHRPLLREEEMVFRTRNGQPVDVSISTAPLQEEEAAGVVVIARDIRQRKRAQRLAAGQKRVLEMATTGAPLATILETLVQVIEAQVEGMLGSILLLDEDQKHLRYGAAPNLPQAYNQAIDGLAIGPQAGSCGTAAYRREAVVVPDIATHPLWTDFRDLAAEHQLRACWSVPIISSRGQILGTFAMYYRVRRQPNDREWQLIDDTIHVARMVIEHKQAENHLRAETARASALLRVAANLNRDLDLPAVLRTVCQETKQALDVPVVTISLYNEQQEAFCYAEGIGVPAEFSKRMQPLPRAIHDRFVQDDGSSIITANIQTLTALPNAGLYVEMDLRTTVNVTLQREGRPIGRLNVATVGEPRDFSTNQLDLLKGLADQAAAAIENARLYQESQQQTAHLAAINTTIASAVAASDLSNLLETALEQVLQALDLKMGLIWISDQQIVRSFPEEVGPLIARIGAEADLPPLDDVVVVEDWQQITANEPWSIFAPLMERVGARASLTVPIWAEGRRLGGLSVSAATVRAWQAEGISLMAAIGRQLGVAIERHHLLERTREQARQMQQIVDTMPDGVLLLDREQRIVLANPAARTYLSAVAEADVGERLSHLAGEPVEALLTATVTQSRWPEVVVKRSPRRIFEVAARSIGTGEELGSQGWVMVIRDVTQERENQQQIRAQERLAAVGQLAAGIAHDFNNVLSAIILHTQLLKRKHGLTPQDEERLHLIHDQAKHASNLIRQILDFSRRSVVERNPLELRHFLKESIQLLERTLPENIAIELSAGDDDYVINADLTRLQQVIMNLAVNARDAMPDGGTLRIGLSRLESGQAPPLPDPAPGPWLCLTVTDSGSGIESQDLPHLFEPFFTTKGSKRGTGLGLAQVYGIVQQHEGHITVDSQVGEGTTFSIYLPALDSSTVLALESPESSSSAAYDSDGGTILVVEDNGPTRSAIQDTLETLGYSVIVADDGESALAFFAEQGAAIDLVVSDMVLPDISGIELYRELGTRQPDLRMIMTTGYPLEAEGRELLEQGILDWIQKPFSGEEIAEKVRKALRGE